MFNTKVSFPLFISLNGVTQVRKMGWANKGDRENAQIPHTGTYMYLHSKPHTYTLRKTYIFEDFGYQQLSQLRKELIFIKILSWFVFMMIPDYMFLCF